MRFALTNRLSVSQVADTVVTLGLALALAGCATPTSTAHTEQYSELQPGQQLGQQAEPQQAAMSASFESVDAFNNMQASDWQQALTPLFNRAREAVQKETGTELSHVSFAVVDNAVIEREVAAETGRLTHSQFTNRAFAQHFLDSVMSGQSGTYAALYSTASQQVMVSDSLLSSYIQSVGNDANAITEALNALLIHELVHAADDTRFGIHRNRNLNFRASFAQSAVYEGHAQFVTRKICQSVQCLSGLGSLDQFMFGDQLAPNQMTQPVQAVSRNVLEYSYVEGERFIQSLAGRENGAALLKKALQNPPLDPIQILDPDSYPNQTREGLNQALLTATSEIDHPWASSPWVRVETSPLKGVNLRSDPARRTAAVDGFTRLIRGMIALQHYDQSDVDASPVEMTLMHAENAQTAEMFAESLSNNLIYNSGGFVAEEVVWINESIPVGVISVDTALSDDRSHIAIVAAHKHFVLQLVGLDVAANQALEYTQAVLTRLHETAGASGS